MIETDSLTAVVVEIDATNEPRALAVQQASLHEVPDGHRLGFGYDLAPAGLGAWVGDRRVRLRVWPVLADESGAILADDPDDPDAELLVVDFDPIADAQALADLIRLGRLIIAGPEAGPLPLVLDVDQELMAEVLAAVAPT